MTSKIEGIKRIYEEVLNLSQSPLYEYRVSNGYVPVVGAGDVDARIMFIGEAPGEKEAKTGEPFCGAAGKVLNKLFESIHVDRKNVYITSVVKDRPPENRDPTPLEISLYSPFLEQQISIIQPAVIATLGRFSMKFIFDVFQLMEQIDSIGNIHGKKYSLNSSYGEIMFIPLYHPALALYNPKFRAIMKEDFKVLKDFI